MAEKAPLVAFRPKPNEIEQLRAVQEHIGGNQSDALRYALSVAAKGLAPREEHQEKQPEEDWRALYFKEKERNESISDRLMELSEKVAESLQAAQVLHGAAVAESKALESEDAKEARKSRWQRLKDAWRG